MYFCVRDCSRIDSVERRTSAELGSRGKCRERVVLRETLSEAEGGAERKDVRCSRIIAGELSL
jgi:hypothetical protein